MGLQERTEFLNDVQRSKELVKKIRTVGTKLVRFWPWFYTLGRVKDIPDEQKITHVLGEEDAGFLYCGFSNEISMMARARVFQLCEIGRAILGSSAPWDQKMELFGFINVNGYLWDRSRSSLFLSEKEVTAYCSDFQKTTQSSDFQFEQKHQREFEVLENCMEEMVAEHQPKPGTDIVRLNIIKKKSIKRWLREFSNPKSARVPVPNSPGGAKRFTEFLVLHDFLDKDYRTSSSWIEDLVGLGYIDSADSYLIECVQRHIVRL